MWCVRARKKQGQQVAQTAEDIQPPTQPRTAKDKRERKREGGGRQGQRESDLSLPDWLSKVSDRPKERRKKRYTTSVANTIKYF